MWMEREAPTVGSMIDDAVRRWSIESPGATAFGGADGAAMTFGQMPDAVAHTAARLARLGVRAGDRVAVMEGRGRCALSALFGVWAVGASAVLLDELHPVDRRRAVTGDADCHVMVSSVPGADQLGLQVVDPEPARAGQDLRWRPRHGEDEA